MKKYLPLIAALLVCAFSVEGSTALLPALIMSLVVIASCILAALVGNLFKKQLSGASASIAAAILGAFFALLIVLLLAAFAYSAFKPLAWIAAACASALLAACAAAEEGSLKKAVAYSLSFAVCTVIAAIIRELFGSAAIAGVAVPALKSFSNTVLAKASGGFVVLAIIMACLKKILPEELNAISLGKVLPFRVSVKLADKSIPEAFRGVPVALLTIGLICLAVFAYL